MKIGDLVKRVHYSDILYGEDKERFLVIDIVGEYHGRRDKTHQMTLKIWEVTEPIGHYSLVPMNVYETA